MAPSGRLRKAWREAPALVLLGGILLLVLVGAAVSVAVVEFGAPPSGLRPGSVRAALIVDALSATVPNETFVAEATRILKEAGYPVEYHPAENATVHFFRRLAAGGHDLVVLRVHSTAEEVSSHGVGPASVAVFTAERFDSAPAVERLTGFVKPGLVPGDGGGPYSAITPAFVTWRMEGWFAGTTVLMMGCEGLANSSLADALVANGVRAVVGWDRDVTAARTDAATLHLLEGMLTERLPLPAAVARTMDHVGPDAEHGSRLRIYP